MPQVKGEWFCAPYVGWHLCRLRLHLWSPLHSSGTFMAPLVYVLMPWRTNECDLKAYSLIDFAITLPDGVDVDRLQGGHESCLDRAWPHSSCPWLPFPSDSGIETLGGMNHVQRSKTGRVPNIGAALLLRGDCKRYFFHDFTRSSWVCISWRAASTSTSTWKGGQRRTDAATLDQFLSVFDLLMTLRTPYKQPYFFRKRSLKGCVFVVKIVHIWDYNND